MKWEDMGNVYNVRNWCQKMSEIPPWTTSETWPWTLSEIDFQVVKCQNFLGELGTLRLRRFRYSRIGSHERQYGRDDFYYKTLQFLHMALYSSLRNLISTITNEVKYWLFQMAIAFEFWALFAKEIHKRHKITSNFIDIRGKLRKKIWSHGTLLGWLHPEFQYAQAGLLCH